MLPGLPLSLHIFCTAGIHLSVYLYIYLSVCLSICVSRFEGVTITLTFWIQELNYQPLLLLCQKKSWFSSVSVCVCTCDRRGWEFLALVFGCIRACACPCIWESGLENVFILLSGLEKKTKRLSPSTVIKIYVSCCYGLQNPSLWWIQPIQC